MHLPTLPQRLGARRLSTVLALSCGLLAAGAGTAAAASPTSVTSPADASLTSDTYGLLSGTVNPNGYTVSYFFRWGPTTAYGNTTPVTVAGNGKAEVPVDFALDTLKPKTTYHYRLVVVAVRKDGDFAYLPEFDGADQTLTTTASDGAKPTKKTARVTKAGKLSVTLKAVGPPDDLVAGTLTLKGKLGKKTKTLATAKYSITAGKSKAIKLTLSTTARRALRKAKHKRLKATLVTKTTGVKKAVTTSLTLVG